METFTPSLDWGNELIASALWVAKAWVIAAVGMVVVLALLARYTKWGGQFWRITGDYFKGRQSTPAWALLGVLLLLVMIDVRLGVLFSYQSNDQFSALQAAFDGEGAAKEAAIHGFWAAMLILVGLAVTDIVRNLLDVYLTQRFIIRWRVWLTHRLTRDWLDGDAYYRGRFVDASDRQPRSAHPAGHRRLHHRHRRGNQHAVSQHVPDAAVRHGLCHRQRRLIHPDPVGARRPADDLRRHGAEGAVLDGARIRVLHDGRRVLDRSSADPAVLPQRAHQRRVPLRAGAAARWGRGHRVVPRRGRRTRPADDEVFGRHRQLPRFRAPDSGVPRLEPVDEPDRRPAPHDRAGSTAVRRRDRLRRRHAVVERVSVRARLAGVLPSRLRLVRELPGGAHPP